MICAKKNTELLFFEAFIERSINGDERYTDIVTPIILEATSFAKGEITICHLSRANLDIKLKIAVYPKATEITQGNLMLPELLEYLEGLNHNL